MSKIWKSYADQIEILRARGMQFHGQEDRAVRYLERIGYYRLSGYWYPMREIRGHDENGQPIRGDRFSSGVSFDLVAEVYGFDKHLRLLAMDASESIELAIQVDIAHLLGKYDPRAHEIGSYFHGNFSKRTGTDGKTGHARWLETYEKALRRNRNKSFVEHNLNNYGYLPIWAAVEIWDFGMLSILFAGMKKVDQDKIARKYGLPEGKFLEQWLRSFNLIRNLSAHHSRLWNANILELSSVPATFSEFSKLNSSRPHLYFRLMSHMLNIISPELNWGSQYSELLRHFPNSSVEGISLQAHGMN